MPGPVSVCHTVTRLVTTDGRPSRHIMNKCKNSKTVNIIIRLGPPVQWLITKMLRMPTLMYTSTQYIHFCVYVSSQIWQNYLYISEYLVLVLLILNFNLQHYINVGAALPGYLFMEPFYLNRKGILFYHQANTIILHICSSVLVWLYLDKSYFLSLYLGVNIWNTWFTSRWADIHILQMSRHDIFIFGQSAKPTRL